MGIYNPIRLLQMLYLSIKVGKFIPFKIYSKSKINFKSGSSLIYSGRINLGTQGKNIRISNNSINIFIDKNCEINFGHSICIGPGVNLILKEGSKLNIGNHTYFTSDSHIEIVKELIIGSDCAISWGVTIIDSDHHTLVTAKAKIQEEGVEIGNHVWIGCNCTILKNTKIGNHCVVAAGSVVKGTFPDNSLIGGNPARILKENINWE